MFELDYSKLNIWKGKEKTSVTTEEGKFLMKLIQEGNTKETLEIGLGFGASAIWMLAAHDGKHTAIDPFQDHYENRGIQNIEQFGFKDRFRFFGAPSQTILPKLADAGEKFGLVFVDGSHRFDELFVDYFFAEKILRDGGYLVFHDSWRRGNELIMNFIRKNAKHLVEQPTTFSAMTVFKKEGENAQGWFEFTEFYTPVK